MVACSRIMAEFHRNERNATSKEMPISALILDASPQQRKYKEVIGDGGDDHEFPRMIPHNDQVEPLQDIETLQKTFSMSEFRAKLRVAEALAQASDMTSSAAKRRLEARRVEMNMNKEHGKPVFLNEFDEEYTPPKELLIYIMR